MPWPAFHGAARLTFNAHNVAITNAFHVSVSSTSMSHFPLRKYHFISFSLLYVLFCRVHCARPLSAFCVFGLETHTYIQYSLSKTDRRPNKAKSLNRITDESEAKRKRTCQLSSTILFCRKLFMASLKTEQIKRFRRREQERQRKRKSRTKLSSSSKEIYSAINESNTAIEIVGTKTAWRHNEQGFARVRAT